MEIMLRKRIVAPETISRRQFFHGLWRRGLITFSEVVAAVGRGEIPAAMLLLIGSMPLEIQEDTFILLTGANTFERSHPSTEGVRQLYGWTPDHRDEFWAFAATF